jgi:hypothetical protein
VPGLIAHSAGFDHDGGVFRIFDIWENGDDARRPYEERLGPIIEDSDEGFSRTVFGEAFVEQRDSGAVTDGCARDDDASARECP